MIVISIKGGKYILIQHGENILYSEHIGEFCCILIAIEILEIHKPAAWKTVKRLITLRQAIRENNAQAMGLEDY